MARSGATSCGVDEWQPNDGGLGSETRGPSSRIWSFFLLLKINFWCQLT
jgi:hypothetical protein